MSRHLALTLLWSASLNLAGQGAWLFDDSRSGMSGEVIDALEVGSGWVISTHFVDDDVPVDVSELVRLNQSGEFIGSLSNPVGFQSLAPLRLVQSTTTLDFDEVSLCRTLSGQYILRQITYAASLERIDSSSITLPYSGFVFFDDAVRCANGSILAFGATTVPGVLGDYLGKMLLVTFNDTGTAGLVEHVNTYRTFIPRSAWPLGGDTILMSSVAGFAEIGMDQPPRVVLSNYRLGHGPLSGVSVPAFDGSGAEPHYGNSLYDIQEVIRVSEGSSIVGGFRSAFGSGRVSVLKLRATDGLWLGAFNDSSEYSSDIVAMRSCLDTTSDGHVVFAYMAGFHSPQLTPFIPAIPNEIRIIKLDTSLNLVCSARIFGAPDSAIYTLTRVKATSDGGFVLMGSKRLLGENQTLAWARKLGPDECFTDVEENMRTASAFAFPNPGNDEVRFTTNGPFRSARVDLFDAHGRLVANGVLQHGQAELHARALASGLYFWRITEADGALLARGKWVKE